MKKLSFLAPLAILASLILPSTAALAAIDASSLGFGDAISNSMNAIGNNLSLTCTVEATTKLVGLTQNEVTYKLKYSSSYSELNATYNVQAASPDTFLHQKGGAFSLVKGNNYVPLTANNSIENKFTYDINGNPSITIQANIKGIKCATKTLQTAKPASAQINPSVAGDTGVNTNLNSGVLKPATTTFNIPLVIPQEHTCKILAEGAKFDSNSLRIGAGIKFDNLAKGKFNYSIRGFLSTSPNLVKEYTGVYSNGVASASGIILDADKKGFIFTFDAKKPTDKYVVAATIGNIDCKLVYFASPVKTEEQVVTPDANNNSDQNAPNGNNGSVSGNTTVSPEAGVDAKTQDETSQLNLLDDKTESTKNTNQPATTSTIIQVMQNASTNYVLYGLLGAIFLSIVTYTVLRYRGMI